MTTDMMSRVRNMIENFQGAWRAEDPSVIEEALSYVRLADEYGEPQTEAKRAVLWEALNLIEPYSEKQTQLRIEGEAIEAKQQRENVISELETFDKTWFIVNHGSAIARARTYLKTWLLGPEESKENEVVDIFLCLLQTHNTTNWVTEGFSMSRAEICDAFKASAKERLEYEGRKTHYSLRAEGRHETLQKLLYGSNTLEMWRERGFAPLHFRGALLGFLGRFGVNASHER